MRENPRSTGQTPVLDFVDQHLKRENRLSAVLADQAGRTVARPHHNSHSKEINSRGQSSAKNPLRIRAK